MKRTCLIVWMIIAVLTVSLSAFGENTPWDCPDCGRTGNTGNFCGGCGHAAPTEPSGADTLAQILPSTVAVGDILTFGHYEQDNKYANGPEEIEWIVLDFDKANHNALLLSKYALDAGSYHKNLDTVTWETCTLRTWLNETFLKKAFNQDEQSVILTTEVDNSTRQGYSKWETDGGNNTQDRIFLLSYAEAKQYLDVDNKYNVKSRVSPTAYAVSRGLVARELFKTEDGLATVSWWLRSPGTFQYEAAIVKIEGSIDDQMIENYYHAIRPALWLNLDAAFN